MNIAEVINTVIPSFLVCGTIILATCHIDDQIEYINKRIKHIEKDLLKRDKEDK